MQLKTQKQLVSTIGKTLFVGFPSGPRFMFRQLTSHQYYLLVARARPRSIIPLEEEDTPLTEASRCCHITLYVNPSPRVPVTFFKYLRLS